MALKIYKLAPLELTATTTVEAVPTVEKFFYQVPSEIVGGTGVTLEIDAEEFTNDAGETGTDVELPALASNNSFYSVYINGVLLMSELLEYTSGTGETGKLVIDVPEGSSIDADSPVVLVVTNFAPTANTTVTQG